MLSRRYVVLAALLLVGSLLLASAIFGTGGGPSEIERVEEDKLVQPVENGSYIWPYTSRSRSTRGRTLAINIVFQGSDERVRRALTNRGELDWQETNESQQDATGNTSDVVLESDVDWDDADGSNRYTYIDPGPHDARPRWVGESYQLHAGAYLGSRYHVRAYASPHDDWTAAQVHQEYWDWFRLRHTVTGVRDARDTLEADFIDQPFVTQVQRTHYGVNRGGGDGWLSVVELATLVPPLPTALVSGAAAGGGFALAMLAGVFSADTRRAFVELGLDAKRWTRRNDAGFILAWSLVLLFLGVRTAGVALETTFPQIPPKVFVGLLYPVLVVGLPFATVTLSRPLRPGPAFGFVVVGLGAAFLLDFFALNLSVVPVSLLVHRVGLLFALGLLGAGAARADAPEVVEADSALVVVGLAGWLLALALPLFGLL